MIYTHQSSGFTVYDGKIVALSDDKLTLECGYVETTKVNNKTVRTDKSKELVINVDSTEGLWLDNTLTVIGFANPVTEEVTAVAVMKDAGLFCQKGLMVARGWVSNAKASTFQTGPRQGDPAYSFNIRAGKDENDTPLFVSVSASNYKDTKGNAPAADNSRDTRSNRPVRSNTRTTDKLQDTMKNLNAVTVVDGQEMTTGIFATCILSPNTKKPQSISEYQGRQYHYVNAYFTDKPNCNNFREVAYKANTAERTAPEQTTDAHAASAAPANASMQAAQGNGFAQAEENIPARAEYANDYYD